MPKKMECPLCFGEMPPEYFPSLSTCSHSCCFDCLQQYLRVEISESRIIITCPECTEPMHPNDIRMILNEPALYEKYEDFMVRRVLAVDPDTRWCPAPDCSYAVIATGCASCPKLKCEREGCNSHFCYHCKAMWHPNQTCNAARAQRSSSLNASSILFNIEAQLSQFREDVKLCPRCKVLIVKMDDGSCNHMTCAFCGAEFCWLCLKEIGDLHYLSPSGCTFWGKKPWSRKKKLLWQLGTLIGAPIGIALIAGISVPAILIGIPVVVGRKLYIKHARHSKLKRNLAIMSGVTVSILVAPILAGLAVGVGVPVLLFYVYGVIPVSLCRSGGCGITTSASGVRINFNEQNEFVNHSNKDSPAKNLSASSTSEPSNSSESPVQSKKLKDVVDNPVKLRVELRDDVQKVSETSSQPESSSTSSKAPTESVSLCAVKEEGCAERVRFDENVSIIDAQNCSKSEGSSSVPFSRNSGPLSAMSVIRSLFFRKSRSSRQSSSSESASHEFVSVQVVKKSSR